MNDELLPLPGYLRTKTGADVQEMIKDYAAACALAARAPLLARIAELESELAALLRGVKVRIPTETMEAEFAAQRRLGVAQGKKQAEAEVERLRGLLQSLDVQLGRGQLTQAREDLRAALKEQT